MEDESSLAEFVGGPKAGLQNLAQILRGFAPQTYTFVIENDLVSYRLASDDLTPEGRRVRYEFVSSRPRPAGIF